MKMCLAADESTHGNLFVRIDCRCIVHSASVLAISTSYSLATCGCHGHRVVFVCDEPNTQRKENTGNRMPTCLQELLTSFRSVAL